MMIATINTGHELYVYFNGILIYKRWLKYNIGRVFHDNEGLTQYVRNEST